MLNHEDDIEEDRNESETEFHGIRVERWPIVDVDRLKNHLKNVEWATGEIKQYVSDGPANGALTGVVEIGLKENEWLVKVSLLDAL